MDMIRRVALTSLIGLSFACENPQSRTQDDPSLNDLGVEHLDASILEDQTVRGDQGLIDIDLSSSQTDLMVSDMDPQQDLSPVDQAIDQDTNEDAALSLDQGLVCEPCSEGYILDEDCRCNDVDECLQADLDQVILCPDSECINHPGGYHCFNDDDGDEVDDWSDNCLGVINPDQADLDGDGLGDLCDDDRDGDLSVNGLDCDDDNPFLGPRLQDSECDGAPDHLSGRTHLSVGWRHTCAIDEAGELSCWGGSPRVEEQNEERFPALDTPLGPMGEVLDDWINVSAGYAHTCGVRLGGILHCWGDDREGETLPPLMNHTETG